MADTKEIKVVINGEDKTKSAFASVSASAKGLKTDVSGLAAGLGGVALAGGAAFVGFLYSAGKAAADAEVQMARVDSILTSMGSSALANRDAILKAADAAVKLGFDDEDAAESITKLYQRTGDLTKAQELSNTAMDLARAKNIDLASATDLVGQVLSGNGRALKAYGIEISDTMTPLEALGVLHEKVSGQSSAFADTFEGKMTTLGIQMNNFKETIGGALLEAVMPFITQLSAWAAKPEVQQKIKEIATVMGELAKEWIPLLVDAMKILFDWGSKIYDVMVGIGNAVIAAGEAIARFAEKVKNSGIGKAVGGTIGGAISEIKYLAGARAAGGPVSGGSSYLVGENGPEIFSPSGSGSIIPNHAMAGAGGITINISGNTLLDDNAGQRIGDQIMRVLKNNLRI